MNEKDLINSRKEKLEKKLENLNLALNKIDNASGNTLIRLAFGQRVKELRVQKNLNQTELGLLIGVERPVVSLYENGTKGCKFSGLIKLSEVLETTIDYLLKGVK